MIVIVHSSLVKVEYDLCTTFSLNTVLASKEGKNCTLLPVLNNEYHYKYGIYPICATQNHTEDNDLFALLQPEN